MTRAPKAASASEGEAAPFKRQLRVDDIGNGEEGAIQASPAECHAIAQMLDLVAVERLDFTYHLRRQAGAQIALKGRRPRPRLASSRLSQSKASSMCRSRWNFGRFP